LLLRDNKPPALYLNQGQGKFQDRTSYAGEDIWDYAFFDAQVADFNHDGKLDLALWSNIGYRVLLNQGDGRFAGAESVPLISLPASPFGFHGTVADLNGDGFDDLLAVDNSGKWHFIANRAGHFREAPFTLSSGKASPSDEGLTAGRHFKAFTTVIPIRLASHGSLDLLALQPDGQIVAFEKQKPAAHLASN
jgi:hypothetical protein